MEFFLCLSHLRYHQYTIELSAGKGRDCCLVVGSIESKPVGKATGYNLHDLGILPYVHHSAVRDADRPSL